MPLEWLPRDNEVKDHELFKGDHWGSEPPCTMYEKKALFGPHRNRIPGLYVAWVTLNNREQDNRYTMQMVKGVIPGFTAASADRSVVAVVLTGVGDHALCKGGDTVEHSEYYSKRPNEYGEYVDLCSGMVGSILNCKKPAICRVNGMRVAGGQEIGMACEVAISSDLAVFGQAGPKYGSAPVGGASDFLPWFLTMEDAIWNCISSELWSAYKMKANNLITRVVPVLKKDGRFLRNPLVHTDTYVEDGEIVYGEFKTGGEAEGGRDLMKSCTVDLGPLDKAVDEVVWRITNLFPGSLQMSIDSIRAKKKFFWDQAKQPNRHWLAANMMGERFLGFTAFSTRKMTGQNTIDFIKYRQLVAKGAVTDNKAFAAVLGTTEG
jgi:6-oxo-cyclohex-1-ene-carbonyl-CoA hydrolase